MTIVTMAPGMREPGTGTPGTTNFAAASALTVTRGQVLVPDTSTGPDSVKIGPTGGASAPFYVAEQDKLSGETGVSAFKDGEVTVVATGAIEVHKQVVLSATTAGRVQIRAAEAADKVVGVYYRHPGEKSGTNSPPTAAADGETIVIDLGKQGV